MAIPSVDEAVPLYNTAGVPSSGVAKVNKRTLQAYLTWLSSMVGGSGATLGQATESALQADIAHPAGTLAIVYADPTPAKNGTYKKVGGSGGGNWTRIGDLPSDGFVQLVVTGGTADAIVTSPAAADFVAPARRLYLLTPDANNTGPATLNGQPIKTRFGDALVADSLLANTPYLVAWVEDEYRLLESAPTDADASLAAALAAKSGAEDARDDAEGFKGDAETYALAAGSAASRFVRLATTANHGLSGLSAIDGVTPIAGDRVLVKSNTDASQNGVYVAASGSWSRATDFDSASEIFAGIVIRVSEGTANGNKNFVLATSAAPVVVGTTELTFTQTSLNGDSSRQSYQQAGADTVQRTVLQVLQEWHKLTDYGGVGDGDSGNAAANATAFLNAAKALVKGGVLTVPPGHYVCDPVDFSQLVTGSSGGLFMTIEGVANPTAGAPTNAMIEFQGTGSDTFWNFDSPAAGEGNMKGVTLRRLYVFSSGGSGYTGNLIQASTPVTDGSKIQFDLTIDNVLLLQSGAYTCKLLDIGKSIETTLQRVKFINGLTHIVGQRGLAVAGTDQVRQCTTVDVRKCEFINCGDYPILYGGEGWLLDSNIFEQAHGGLTKAFMTNADYPIEGMTWINNWFGDPTVAGYQWIIVYGHNFNFWGNVMGGYWLGGESTGSQGISLNNVKGFDIRGNTFKNLSTCIEATSGVNDGGKIESNNWGLVCRELANVNGSTGSFGSNVKMECNYPAASLP